eukprot:s3666_g1.t1
MDVASAEGSGISPEKFEEHMKLSYLCVAVVTMTSEREVGSTTVRKLEVNEVLEALGVARREPQSGLVRVECKAKDDAQGFVTVAGSGGTTYLEVYTPFMACVRTAEEALADSYESVSQTVAYLKQKHDELRSTRGAAALQDLKEQLQNLRARSAYAQMQKLLGLVPFLLQAQVAHSDVKNKVAEAKNRHERQLEALKKKRQQAEEKLAADTITGEASSMVDDLIAKVTAACAEATSVLSNCTGTGANSAGSLQALEQVEKDLQSAVEACQEELRTRVGEAKIMKTVMEEIRNASKGPLFDARKVMFRLKVKLSPLPNNCKKHLRTIEEKKKEVLEDVRQMVADLLREHAINHDLSSDALFEQLRKAGEGDDTAEETCESRSFWIQSRQRQDGTITLASFRTFLLNSVRMGEAELELALQGFEANLTRFALLDLVMAPEAIAVRKTRSASIAAATFKERWCVKEVAVTPALEVKGSTAMRKLELEETVEVLGQHSTEEAAGLLRSRCRALRDNLEGWVTLNGNQGTAFLKRISKPYYFCKAETPLMECCASTGKPLGTARHGELLEVLEGPRLEKTAEVSKAKGKAIKDPTCNPSGDFPKL